MIDLSRRIFLAGLIAVGSLPVIGVGLPTVLNDVLPITEKYRTLFDKMTKKMNLVLTYHIFEYNDNQTRQSIIDDMIAEIEWWKDFYDYTIICDQTNNTSEVIDANQLVMDLYIKPSENAEFIWIRGIAQPKQAYFEETIKQFPQMVLYEKELSKTYSRL